MLAAAAGLIGGTDFAVDASLVADANKCPSTPGDDWSHDIDPEMARRAVQDYQERLKIRPGAATATSEGLARLHPLAIPLR
jgi:hypothetical protein